MSVKERKVNSRDEERRKLDVEAEGSTERKKKERVEKQEMKRKR